MRYADYLLRHFTCRCRLLLPPGGRNSLKSGSQSRLSLQNASDQSMSKFCHFAMNAFRDRSRLLREYKRRQSLRGPKLGLQFYRQRTAGAPTATETAKDQIRVHEGCLLQVERSMTFATSPHIRKITFKL